MADRRHRVAVALAGVLVLAVMLAGKRADAFGDSGAFHPRLLVAGQGQLDSTRRTAAGRWAWELTRRTSAPARLAPTVVRADSQALLDEPFAYWMGSTDIGSLSSRELQTLGKFFAMGGVLLVDDIEPQQGGFGVAARRELARVLPNSAPVAIGVEHVLFRSFYLLRRPAGRVLGPPSLEAIVRNGMTQVIFSSHDLAGALAQDEAIFGLPVVPGGEAQREEATRLAVNIAMYVLCSNYKDDQVHSPFLMRRRARDLR